MTTRNISPESSVQSWRVSYRTALFERDEQKLALRVAEAEKALILRAKELYGKSDRDSEEELAIEDAFYALKALRHSLELRTRESSSA